MSGAAVDSWPDEALVRPEGAAMLAAHGFILLTRARFAPSEQPTLAGEAGVDGIRFPRPDEQEADYVTEVLRPAVETLVQQLPAKLTRLTLPPIDSLSNYDVLQTFRSEQMGFALRLEVRTGAKTATLIVGFEGCQE